MGQTAASFIASFRDTLETAVQADAKFTSVPVFIVDEGTSGLIEHITLIRPESEVGFTQEHAAFGRGSRNDEFTIPGQFVVLATGQSTEDSATFETAMGRAEDLLEIVIGQIKTNPPSVGTQTLRTIVASGGLRPARVDQGWVVVGDFDIDAMVRVS